MKTRYIIHHHSQSGHCCFEYTVLDSTKPEMISDEHYRNTDGFLQYEAVCETFDLETATLVRDALNAADK